MDFSVCKERKGLIENVLSISYKLVVRLKVIIDLSVGESIECGALG